MLKRKHSLRFHHILNLKTKNINNQFFHLLFFSVKSLKMVQFLFLILFILIFIYFFDLISEDLKIGTILKESKNNFKLRKEVLF